MKKKHFLPWVLGTASALITAGVIAQPLEDVRLGSPSPMTMSSLTAPQTFHGSRKKLHLSDAQQALWEQAQADSTALRQAVRDNFVAMHTAVTAELDKAVPDYAHIAGIEKATWQTNQALLQKMQDIWLQVYVVLSDQQQAMVRQAMAWTSMGQYAKAQQDATQQDALRLVQILLSPDGGVQMIEPPVVNYRRQNRRPPITLMSM